VTCASLTEEIILYGGVLLWGTCM